MKVLALIFCMLFATATIAAQQDMASRILTETAVSSEKIVKGSPFSADAVSESVQVLADGNRIVRSSTNKMYRNSEGRFRRELAGGSGGLLGSFYSVGPGITILDPVVGFRYMIDSELKTARVGSLPSVWVTTPASPLPPGSGDRAAAVSERLKAELLSTGRNVSPDELNARRAKELAGQAGAATIERSGSVAAERALAGQIAPAKPKYETRTERLGVQVVEGIEAEGTRTVTTIPAGEIGNERPIEIVYEMWYSNELQLVVMSRHSDPRFGEQTYRLTNIIRSEPDPSLFELPNGFKVVPTPGTAYTVSSGNARGQSVVYTTVPPSRPAAPKAPRP
ncbi:MAG TPA: hypothetical protein PKD26_12530 [Pyrinomonadaceae bacterium]|nr:hypothetical protein [Pyrinomonadaceae bacterium]